MKNTIRITSVLALLTVLLFLLIATIPMVGAASNGSRAMGTVTVPQWKEGDNWGFKTGSYGYYYGVGFEVEGTETVNNHKCYKVKIWWDASYGTDTTYDYDFDMPGFSYTYKYLGYAYFTTEDLAIVKFTNELEMRTKYDGAELYSNFGTRAQDEFNIDDYTDMLENMKEWQYDIYCHFKITYDYDPPFVMYDYPLEVGKKWNSTSTVTVNWDYKTKVDVNDAMKKYMEEYSGTDLTGLDAVDEEGSDSTKFTFTGSFEVLREDTVTTDTGTFDVFVIDYDIYTSFLATRQTTTEPPIYYGDVSVPGGDATLTVAGGNDGSGTSYFDPVKGYPQKIEPDGYFSDTHYTVDPSSIENSYNDLAKPSSFAGGDKDDGGVNTLLLIAGIITVVMVVIIVVIVLLIKKMSKRGDQQYPPQGPPQQPPQQQYPQYPPQQQYPPYPPQQQYPPQEPQQPPAYPPPQY